MIFEQPLRLVVFQPQTLPFGLGQAAVFANQLPAFDSPRYHPDEIAGGGCVDADVGVGADFEALGRQLLLALLAEHDQRLVGASGAEAFEKCQGIEFARLVADQHGVEDFVAQSRHACRYPNGFFQHDVNRAIGRERLGQPAACAMVAGDVQHPHARGQTAPGRLSRPCG